ncbi:Hypothetical predicted protein [Mytilus galloprovincialis]|uniref:Uncharacterized protein n=1 Tax=Mytilus galloprovincialis TaxID=29158 RepID=A0A8B6G3N3_MYTGA|nr:Hypothetical predicted protein [Mytilus galloprovincialis]
MNIEISVEGERTISTITGTIQHKQHDHEYRDKDRDQHKELISDMICLMDGRVIVVEEYGKVNLLTSDGKLQKQLPIPGEAWGVTQINQNTIAITYPNERAIKIFNMEKETVTKVITLDKACYGLSFSNGSLAVGLIKDEIRIIDLEGNTLKSIQVESKSLPVSLCLL